jgi:hypothetical protein
MWEEDQGPKTPFAAAIGRFVAARQSLAEALAAARANEFVVGRVNVVGSDVENAAELLDTIHDQARDAYAAMYAESEDDPVTKVLRDPKYVHGSDDALAEAWQAAINSESAEARLARIKRSFRLTFRPTRRLATAYKAFFFFVRAYQDVMYCLLNNSSSGSMGSAFKNEHNPIRVYLDDHLPSYVAWFSEFRRLRNKIKDGFGAALSSMGSPRGSGSLGLIVTQPPTAVSVYHLSDAATALDFSSQLTEVTAETVRSRAAEVRT